MIGIIDYNAGKVKSVERALDALGCEYVRATSPQALDAASKLIFPGVGDAQYAMDQLKKSGFDAFLKDKVAQNVPVLGICLGSQIIFDFSEEGDTPCLGLIPGTIKHFSSIKKDFPLKVPHMGWNQLYDLQTPLMKGLNEQDFAYFVHSYYVPTCEFTIAKTDYIHPFSAALHRDNFYATQFHPEKSGRVGERIIQNFLEL